MEMDLAPLHPIVVHFAIGLLMAGVLFRLASLAGEHLLGGRLAFAGPAACVLLLAGAVAAFGALKSGEAAEGAAEDIPGAHDAVEDHQKWANRTFWLFAVVAALEAGALVLRRFGKAAPAVAASGLLGLGGLYLLYETGEHGGEVVYSHAGGVGTRTGDPKDVGRLLLAGLYQQAVLDRGEGRRGDAAALIETAAVRFPGDLEVQLLLAESQLEDRKDAALATTTLSRLQIPREEARLRLRHGILLVDAILASGHVEAAKATLQNLASEFPDSALVRERMRRITQASSSPAESTPAATPSPAQPSPISSPAEPTSNASPTVPPE
jgi:uncharacterized membrane protein